MDVAKHILYISYDGMTDPLGQSQVLPYIIGLSKKGFSFTLISCEKTDRFEIHKSTIESICRENHIDWQPLIYHKSPPILSTIYDIWKIQTLAYSLHTKYNYQIIHCRGYISALIGLAMKRKFQTPFIFDMRGFWADEKVDAKAWNLNNFIYKSIYKFFKQKEQDFLLNANASVCLTYKGKEEILSWNYMQEVEDNISVIPCCVDIDLFQPETITEAVQSTWREKLGITKDDYILSYIGSIGTWYMLDEMLDFFVEFLKYKPRAKFLFITHDEHDRIRDAATKRNIDEYILIQPAQRKEVPRLISLSQASIFFIRPTYSKMASSPTKQGEIMALNIPIICNAGVGDTDNIVLKYNAGYIVNSFDNKAYADAIKKMEIDNTVSDSRKGALEYFSLASGVERYYQIYQSII